ncbi:arylacetamide deacetylase-like 4 [Alligator sinensis]|uniref:Arylacetamide deacetylase-like 4 n=1 Tax=Alligator sinensis TaxID=38654 RepID=A0A1U8CVH9_ALLSI|nr:arylacetamide deacetylase-like 4 [Alligator sinensis]
MFPHEIFANCWWVIGLNLIFLYPLKQGGTLGLVDYRCKGKGLEKMGICRFHTYMRYVLDKKKHKADPKLFIKNLQFEKVPVRVYEPRAPSAGLRKGIIFFHGGGGVFGSVDTHDNVCRYIARESEAVVASVEYRLAPEHKPPAQYEDCLTAAIHFMRNPEDYGVDPTRIITAGDSAGAYLAATVTQTLSSRPDLPKLRAQVLMYPFIQALDFNLPSYQQYCRIPLLSQEEVILFALQWLKGNTSILKPALEGAHIPPEIRLKYRKWLSPDNIPKEFKVKGYKPHFPTEYRKDIYEQIKLTFDPLTSPLLAEEAIVCQLPETFLMTCEYDVLRDDGLLYKKRLEDCGVSVTWHHGENAFHGIINLFDSGMLTFPAGKRALDNIVSFLRGL